MSRIKTLAQIGDQCDRIIDYLDRQGRTETSCKVQHLYDCIMGRILDSLRVDEFDDDAIEEICMEPLIAGVSY